MKVFIFALYLLLNNAYSAEFKKEEYEEMFHLLKQARSDVNSDIAYIKNCEKNFNNLSDIGKGLGLDQNGEEISLCVEMDYYVYGLGLHDQAKIDKEEHLKKLKFKEHENLLSLIKNKQYQRAFNYYQLYADSGIVFKKDNEGNSIYHLLAQSCNDPIAMELFGQLSGIDAVFSGDISSNDLRYLKPLQIKRTKSELNSLRKRCELESSEKINKNFMIFSQEEIVNSQNKKGEFIYDVKEFGKCEGTYIGDFFLDNLKENYNMYNKKKQINLNNLRKWFPKSYYLFLDKIYKQLSEDDKKEILEDLRKQENVHLFDDRNRFLFKQLNDEDKFVQELKKIASDKVYEGFNKGKINKDGLERILISSPEIVTYKNNSGISLLDLLEVKEPEIVQRSKSIILSNMSYENTYSKPETLQILNSLIRNSYKLNSNEKKEILYLADEINDADFNKKVQDELYEYIDFHVLKNESNPTLGILKKSDEELSNISLGVCKVLGAYIEIDCEQYKKYFLNISKSDNYLTSEFVNLISLAQKTNQNTASILLIRELNNINPDLAKKISNKLEIGDLFLSDKEGLYGDSLIKLVKEGSLDCSINRDEFSYYLQEKYSLKKNDRVNDNCRNRNSKQAFAFVGFTKDSRPILMEKSTTDSDLFKKEDPYLDKANRVIELTKDGRLGRAGYELYELTSSVKDAKELNILKSNKYLNEYIYNLPKDSCPRACLYVAFANTLKDFSDDLKTVGASSVLAGELTVIIAQATGVTISGGASLAVAAVYGATSLGVNVYGNISDYADCREGCYSQRVKISQDDFKQLMTNYEYLIKSNDDTLSKLLAEIHTIAEIEKNGNANKLSISVNDINNIKKNIENIVNRIVQTKEKLAGVLQSDGIGLSTRLNMINELVEKNDELGKKLSQEILKVRADMDKRIAEKNKPSNVGSPSGGSGTFGNGGEGGPSSGGGGPGHIGRGAGGEGHGGGGHGGGGNGGGGNGAGGNGGSGPEVFPVGKPGLEGSN